MVVEQPRVGKLKAIEGGVLFGLRMVETDEVPIGGVWFCRDPMMTSAEDLTGTVGCLNGTKLVDSGMTAELSDSTTLLNATVLVSG